MAVAKKSLGQPAGEAKGRAGAPGAEPQQMETDNTEMVAQGDFGGASTFLGSPFRTPGVLLSVELCAIGRSLLRCHHGHLACGWWG